MPGFVRRAATGLMLVVVVLSTANVVLGQAARENNAGPAELRNPAQPMLVYNATGHVAPVRALVFVPDDEGVLLSGGLDRVVNVWNTGGTHHGLARTFRPPLGRAPRGFVHALAVSPTATNGNQRVVAVAGISSANMPSSPILLYRFPSAMNLDGGAPFATLPPITPGQEQGLAGGVRDAIYSMAFDASGKVLASSGADKAIVVWDVANERVFRRIEIGDTRPDGYVNKVILSADGRWLWSGGRDGYLHLWDLAPAVPQGYLVPPILPAGSGQGPLADNQEIVSLALSPDQSVIVAGREDGTLTRYDAATLANPRHLIPETQRKGPIDALAFHPKPPLRVGLARINASFRDPSDTPVTECLIEIRSAENGDVVDRGPNVTDLVRACAFNNDGNVFAYAGGESQSIYLKDSRTPAATPSELRGEGSTIRGVGFDRESRRVAILRGNSGRGEAAAPIEAFDLKGRRLGLMKPEELDPEGRRARMGPFVLKHPGPTTVQVDWGTGHVDLGFERRLFARWWSSCFIPNPDAKGYPAVAVGCEHQILIFTFSFNATGEPIARQTRHLRGHAGPILALSVSPDGKWLASGGADQAVRLWPVPSLFEPAKLGARFQPRGDELEITAIDPDGFAERALLKVGDLVKVAAIKTSEGKALIFRSQSLPLARFDPLQAVQPPGTPLQFEILRDGQLRRTMTSMQDDPVVSLFLTDQRTTIPKPGAGPDVGPGEREWVVWNPDGYYDTSVTADRRFLGWHRNAEDSWRSPANLLKNPTSYVPIRAFESLLRKPDVIDSLLAGKPRSEALPKRGDTREPLDIAAAIDDETPPTIRLIGPIATGSKPIVVEEPQVVVQVELAEGAGKNSKLKEVSVRVNGQQVAQPAIPAQRPAPLVASVPLSRSGVNMVTITAINNAGREQPLNLAVEYRPKLAIMVPPPTPIKDPELIVIAIGAGQFMDGGFKPIESAELDANGVVKEFFASQVIQTYHAVYPPKRGPLPSSPVVRVSHDATQGKILEVFDALKARGRDGAVPLKDWGLRPPRGSKLGPGDTVVLAVSSHVIDSRSVNRGAQPVNKRRDTAQPTLVAADTYLKTVDATGVDTDLITETLEELVKEGCRVVAIIDGFHDDGDDAREGIAVREWAYRLDKAEVVVCLASDTLPSLPARDASADGSGKSPFFSSLISLNLRDHWEGEEPDRITLDSFRRLLVARVKTVTKSKMEPIVYRPATVHGTIPLFDPPSPPPAMARSAVGARASRLP